MNFSDALINELKTYADKYDFRYEAPVMKKYEKLTLSPIIKPRFFTVKHSGQTIGIVSEADMIIMMSKVLANSPQTFFITLYRRDIKDEIVFSGYSVRSQYCDEYFRAELA